MKNLCDPSIAKYRDHEADRLYGTEDHERAFGGAFLVPYSAAFVHRVAPRQMLRVIASAGRDQTDNAWRWDHVSVSLSNRCPTWDEMDYIKRLFFHPEEVCYQLHVSSAEHISNHDYCLHIWRPVDLPIPLPPPEMVGTKERPMPFTNDEKLQAVKRELAYRRRVYENRVRDKKMTQSHADHQIKLFEEIEADYEALAGKERLL